jgi:hypothetical protein
MAARIHRALDEPLAVEELKHKRALWREEADSEALELTARENKFLLAVQLDLEGEAAARAVKHPK